MKKYALLILVITLSFGLFACGDTKTYNESVTVYFFTANRGATSVESFTNLEADSYISAPDEPTRIGYEFNGWYTDVEKTNLFDFQNDSVGDSSFILYAGWTPAIFAINYDVNGGIMPSSSYPVEFTVGQSLVLPTPTRLGYSFVAWYTYDWVDTSSTIPGDPGYQVLPSNEASDIDLYAHWEPAIVSLFFKANYPIEGEGPSNPSNRSINYGDIIDFTQLDDTDDYTFLGWNSKSDGTGVWYVNGDVFTRTQRTTVYAIWEAVL